MIDTISKKFHAWTTGWRVIILLVLYGVMGGYVMPLASGLMAFAANAKVTPLDLMFFYTPDKAFAMIEQYGEAGRALYIKIELVADMLYPMAYTMFLGLLISWALQRAFPSGSGMQKMNAMPFGAWLFDMFENTGIISMLAMYPSQAAVIAWLTMFLGTIKWMFAFASIGFALFCLAKAGMNGFKKQV